MIGITPYYAGQIAFRDGRPISDNPHGADEQYSPRVFGNTPRIDWDAGWQTAQFVAEHSATLGQLETI